jgi:putative flippase GtrA
MFLQMVRFGSVGGLATVVHVIVAVLMRDAFSVSPLQANLAGFCSALFLSYFGHAYLTFGTTLKGSRQFLRFLFVAVSGLAVSTTTVWCLNIKLALPFEFAMAAVAVLVPAASYVAMRFWVFSETAVHNAAD